MVQYIDERTDGNLMKGDLVELAMEEVQQGSSDPLLEKVHVQVSHLHVVKGALSRYCTITLKNLKLPMHQWKP